MQRNPEPNHQYGNFTIHRESSGALQRITFPTEDKKSLHQ